MRAHRALLVVAGSTALAVGGGLLAAPISFRQSVGVALSRSASVLSETRAPGAALLAAGAVMLAGAASPARARLALGASALVYLSFGAGRLVSIALDGLPHTSLLVAMAVELVLGVVSLRALRAEP